MLDYLAPYHKQCNLPELLKLKEERNKWKERPSNKHYTDLLSSLTQLPNLDSDLDQNPPKIGDLKNITITEQEAIKRQAQKLIPWRKGPFNLFDIKIDAEWRSDHKWERIHPHIDSLTNKKVLDIGCNNGYFLFKMATQNPALALGIDPVFHCQSQFYFIQHFAKVPNLHFELFGVEHVSLFEGLFDTIFSMGIIYHHRHPIEQLIDMRNALKPGGQLVLETIGIPGELSYALFPEDRYAKMKNVWFVPTVECFKNWALRAKFIDVEIISDTPLTTVEQRLTQWCPPPHQSLSDFLDPSDPKKTIEGHPAPRRFALVARKKQ